MFPAFPIISLVSRLPGNRSNHPEGIGQAAGTTSVSAVDSPHKADRISAAAVLLPHEADAFIATAVVFCLNTAPSTPTAVVSCLTSASPTSIAVRSCLTIVVSTATAVHSCLTIVVAMSAVVHSCRIIDAASKIPVGWPQEIGSSGTFQAAPSQIRAIPPPALRPAPRRIPQILSRLRLHPRDVPRARPRNSQT